MKYFFYTLLFSYLNAFSQNSINSVLITSKKLEVENLISIDNYETIYYTQNNILYKKTNQNIINYNNIQLGNIESINTFNPLKINVFYKEFNTVIILDNRLAEVFKIDFNTLPDYKNISHISTGFDNTIWIFNQDLQQVELFDYKQNKIRLECIPIQSEILDLKSNYNMCWLLSKEYIYAYNYFGSLVKKIRNTGYSSMTIANDDVVLSKENHLFYLKKNEAETIPIILPNLLINQFFVTNETLYIGNKSL